MAAVQLNHQHRQEGAGCFEYLSLGCSQVRVVSDDENDYRNYSRPRGRPCAGGLSMCVYREDLSDPNKTLSCL